MLRVCLKTFYYYKCFETDPKVCLEHYLLLDLWNINSSTFNHIDGGHHCHVSSATNAGIVERFFLGWDGALYCAGYCSDDIHYKFAAEFTFSGPKATSKFTDCYWTCPSDWTISDSGCLDGGGRMTQSWYCAGGTPVKTNNGDDC